MIKTPQLRQLADGDSIFVSVESSEAPSHMAGLVLLDPTTSPNFGFERFVETLRERIDLVPRFKWRLKEVPMGLDRAYWVEDPAFDVSDHLKRVAVPMPRNLTALAEVAGFLHKQPIDRSRPLWEGWWIEGMENDQVAVLMKIHHSLMDGQSGIGLTEILMDLEPDPKRLTARPIDTSNAPPRSPRSWEITQRILRNGLYRQRRMAIHAGRAARDLAQSLNETTYGPPAPKIPRASFNHRLSRDREFAFATLPLQPLRDAKKYFAAKMNDVLLEIVSSTLRHGLLKTGELPSRSLVALCPISLREPGDQSFGNQLASMPVTLATDLSDPSARLNAIRFSAEQAKRRAREGAFEILTALGESLPPAALQWITKTLHRASDRVPLPANLVFSNVRGAPIATYMAGARVERLYPMSMLQVANGMNITAVTHDDQVDFGFLVDPRLIPDPWIFANGISDALEELREAATEAKPQRPTVGVEANALPCAPDPGLGQGARSDDARKMASSGHGRKAGARALDMSLIMAGLEPDCSAQDPVV